MSLYFPLQGLMIRFEKLIVLKVGFAGADGTLCHGATLEPSTKSIACRAKPAIAFSSKSSFWQTGTKLFLFPFGTTHKHTEREVLLVKERAQG